MLYLSKTVVLEWEKECLWLQEMEEGVGDKEGERQGGVVNEPGTTV